MALRAYAAAYAEFHDPNMKMSELSDGPMMRQVKLNHFRRQFGREPVIADE